MVSALMSNKLQKCLNWTGRCNKIAFGELQCATIILRKPYFIAICSSYCVTYRSHVSSLLDIRNELRVQWLMDSAVELPSLVNI
jgi:hypothetical protein